MKPITKSDLKHLERFYDRKDPVIREYLKYGPIRLKPRVLENMKYNLKVDKRYSSDNMIKADRKIIKRVENIPIPYIVVWKDAYRALTEEDAVRSYVGIKHLRKIRYNKLKKNIKMTLTNHEKNILIKLLSKGNAPKGHIGEYNKIRIKLGLPRKLIK